MSFTIQTEQGEIEVEQDAITPPDGVKLVELDNPPKGLFNEDGMNAIVKERLKKEDKKLLNDKQHQRKVADKLGVTLDDNMEPEGLEPEVDVNEATEKAVKEVSEDYEKKLAQKDEQISTGKEALKERGILSIISGEYNEQVLKNYGGDKIIAVEQIKPFVGAKDGNLYPQDEDGNKIFKGDGALELKEFLLNPDGKFSDMLKDKTQGGSDFESGGSNGNKTFTDEEVKNMSTEEFEANKDDILKSMN